MDIVTFTDPGTHV